MERVVYDRVLNGALCSLRGAGTRLGGVPSI
jgi:hypothetical protein